MKEEKEDTQRSASVALLLLVVVALGAQLVLALARVPAEPPPRYEYMIASPEDVALRDELAWRGLDGWRIVSARRAVSDGEPIYELILMREAPAE